MKRAEFSLPLLTPNSQMLPPIVAFFDLETTGLGPSCDIVQLAAVSGEHTLNLFMVPRCRMQRSASQVTGFRVRRHRLLLHHRPMLTNSLQEVLVSFIAFIRMLGCPLLVGHNIRRFDCRVLGRALDEFHLRAEFQLAVSGFLDTLPLARQLLRDRGLQSFRQDSLVKAVLGVSYAAHNALEDVQALQRLYAALMPTTDHILQHTFTFDSMAAATTKQPPVIEKEPNRLPGQSLLWDHFSKAVRVTGDASGGSAADS